MNQLYANDLLSSNETRVPRNVQRFNRLLVGLFIAAVFLIFALLQLLVDWAQLEHRLVELLNRLFARRANGALPIRSPQSLAPPHLPKTASRQPTLATPGAWQHIAMTVLMIAVVLAAAYLLFRLAQKLWRWYLNQHRSSVQDLVDYVDHEESIEPDRRRILRRLPALKVSRNRHAEDLSSLEQQIRHSYRQFVRHSESQGFEWASTDTARQTTERIQAWLVDSANGTPQSSHVQPVPSSEEWDALKDLYDEARYRRGGVSEANAQRFSSVLLKRRLFPTSVPARASKRRR